MRNLRCSHSMQTFPAPSYFVGNHRRRDSLHSIFNKNEERRLAHFGDDSRNDSRTKEPADDSSHFLSVLNRRTYFARTMKETRDGTKQTDQRFSHSRSRFKARIVSRLLHSTKDETHHPLSPPFLFCYCNVTQYDCQLSIQYTFTWHHIRVLRLQKQRERRTDAQQECWPIHLFLLKDANNVPKSKRERKSRKSQNKHYINAALFYGACWTAQPQNVFFFTKAIQRFLFAL